MTSGSTDQSVQNLQALVRRECNPSGNAATTGNTTCYTSRFALGSSDACPSHTTARLCCDGTDPQSNVLTALKGTVAASDTQQTRVCGARCTAADRPLTAYQLCRAAYPRCASTACPSAASPDPSAPACVAQQPVPAAEKPSTAAGTSTGAKVQQPVVIVRRRRAKGKDFTGDLVEANRRVKIGGFLLLVLLILVAIGVVGVFLKPAPEPEPGPEPEAESWVAASAT
jgi:hypothetical protein